MDPKIGSPGNYGGKSYYIEESTFETSYKNTFSLQKEFPSFSRLNFDGTAVYFDVLNKITIKSNPIIRNRHILEKINRFLNVHPKELFMTQKVAIDRSNLVDNAWIYFLPTLKTRSIYNIMISFINEIGEDHGALKREFIYLLSNKLIADLRIVKDQELYDVNTAYPCPEFIYYYTNRNEQIEAFDDIFSKNHDDNVDMLPASLIDYQPYFVLLGATVACILLLSETLHCNFSLIFYENLLSRKFTIRHVQDPELQRHLSTASRVTEHIVESLFNPKKNQYDHIKFGFDFVLDSTNKGMMLSKKLSQSFCAFDFSFIFYHFEPINPNKLKNQVGYVNCHLQTREIIWLWQELDKKDQHFLSKFLLFITGSGNLPSSIDECIFTIEKTRVTNELFRSSACIKTMYIPGFDSREILSKSLETSILNSEGYHFI